MLKSISQRSLHRKTFDVGDERITGLSLFPFFDDRGVVRRLMLVAEDSAKIVLVAREHLDLNLPRALGKRSIAQAWSGLPDTDAESAAAAASLWHFDPWWLLAEERFNGHPAVAALRGTNLPGHLPFLSGLWFRRDLSRVTRYYRMKRGEPVIERFTEELVAGLARPLPSVPNSPNRPNRPNRKARPASGWVLRPFWMRPGRL